MQRDIATLIAGSVAGAIGTCTMSAVMLAGQKAGMLGTPPPVKLTEQALHSVGVDDHHEVTRDVLTVVLHWGFGAGMGAVFGLLYRRSAVPLSAPTQGMIFATTVWVLSYQGWIPALGLMPPPARDRPGRPLIMVLAHWVYGWTMGRAIGAVSEWRVIHAGKASTASAAYGRD